jgi:hypothetical protein
MTGGRPTSPVWRILFYHRVPAGDELAVSPRSFAQHMDFLASQSYNVVDVVEAVDLLGNGSLRPRTVGLSSTTAS